MLLTQATAVANTATDVIADSEWAAIKLLAQKGDEGVSGLKQVQGYLYYEKTSNTGVAPSAPGSTTYTFSTGDIDVAQNTIEVDEDDDVDEQVELTIQDDIESEE